MHCDVRYADAVKVSAVVMRMNCTADEPALLVLEVTMHIGRLVETSIFEVPVDQHEAASHVLVAHPMRYAICVVAPLPVTLVTMPGMSAGAQRAERCIQDEQQRGGGKSRMRMKLGVGMGVEEARPERDILEPC